MAKKKQEYIETLTNPFIDAEEIQEKIFHSAPELTRLIKNSAFQDAVRLEAEENIKGLWGSVLRALLLKSLEGEPQAMKILFDYVENRRLIAEAPPYHRLLEDLSPGQRKHLDSLLRSYIAKAGEEAAEEPVP